LNDREIDERLNGIRLPHGPRAETMGHIAESIAGSMRPVRPLPPRWVLAGAAVMGFQGIAKMNILERSAVFSALGILVLVAANELVSAMIPGSRRRISSGRLLAVTGLCLAAVLSICFRDYQTTHFVHEGLVCLGIGLVHAIAAGSLSWLVLRRGFAVDAVSAGLAAGTLAGLAGIGMLELHCSNLQTSHVLVWHVGVLMVSAGLGALCGWRSSSVSAKRETPASRDTHR
jgi:hypothetical protein